MNDRHEQSRAAFEAAHPDFSHSWDEGKKKYRDIHTLMYWDTWCRALDYAAEQQAAPTPLTRPDRPGWWWCWSEHGTPPRWLPVVVQPAWKCNDGIWVEATPPPAPTGKEDRR